MMRLARTDEHPLVVSVPDIVGVAVVAVQPPFVVVVVDFEHVRVAVRIGTVQSASRATAHRILSELYRIRHLKCLSTLYQVSSYF